MTGSHNSGAVAASNTPHAADNLTEKRFLTMRENTALETAQDLESTWRSIVGLFTKTVPREKVGSHLDKLTVVMRNEHVLEEDFNKQLFLALRECLDHHKLIYPLPKSTNNEPVKPEDYPIVFKYEQRKWPCISNKYAIGIAREVRGEQKFDDNRNMVSASTGSSGNSNSGLASRCKMDHCTCLLKEELDGTWSVVEVLSACELKISDAPSFLKLQVLSNDRSDHVVEPFELRSVGPVAQVMSYTMGWVLPSHTKLGVLKDSLRWNVIIGTKRAKEAHGKRKHKKRKVIVSPERTLAVSGKIHIPEVCGGRFQYSVTGYVRSRQQDDESDDDESSSPTVDDKALVLYLEAIYFGLEAGKKWMIAKQPVEPCPTSGQRVMIGPTVLTNLKWRGSATLGSLLTDHPNQEGRHWKISQGELFSGKLNMHRILLKIPAENLSRIVVFNASNETRNVVVKVFSPAVHQYLVPQDKSFAALYRLCNEKTLGHTDLDLSNVLYAVYKLAIGMITIMADLSKEGYKVLRPISCCLNGIPLSELWEAFTTLVDSILLPMAKMRLIHPDIRPGFDVTSNILIQIHESITHNQATVMRLIDFESIMPLDEWQSPTNDFTYIKSDGSWSAETFVWWQCVAVAFAWLEEKYQHEMEKEKLERSLLEVAWSKLFRGLATKRNLNSNHVRDLCRTLAEEMRNHEKSTSNRERKARQYS